MTRHKDEATLYAGRDDFRDYERLADRLGRQQIKESTLDYTRAAQGPTRAEEATRGDAADRAYEQELRERVQPEKTLQEVREQSEQSLQSEHAERTLQQARELSAQGVQVERAEQTLQQARELSERTLQGEQAEQTLQQVDELRELQAKAKAAGDEDAGKRTLQELRELSERNFEKPTSEAERAYVQEVHGRVQPERTLREADDLRELQAKAKAAGDEHAATRTLSELREQNLQQAAPATVVRTGVNRIAATSSSAPITTMAMGARVSAPGSSLSASGIMPKIIVADVIRIGRKRTRAASWSASVRPKPRSRRVLA